MQAANEVGGDFYDFFMIDEERLGVIVGDVAGKGVPAAIYMSLSRTLLRATAQLGLDAGECLRHANRTLCSEGDAGLFVTTIYVILNTRTGAVQYSAGGHFPPYFVRASGAVESSPLVGGMVLGIESTARYDSGHSQMASGDLMVLYSDGVSEAANLDDDLFGDERLEAALAEVAGAPEGTAIKTLAERVRTFANGRSQSDDITLVAVRRT
jgi:sigma-B regulation protein RsbU (phosphoserine phosphatase)